MATKFTTLFFILLLNQSPIQIPYYYHCLY